jgi:hypothetical protein
LIWSDRFLILYNPTAWFIGKTDSELEILEEVFATSGAAIVGRRTYDLSHAWEGSPPGGLPFFVLTHHIPEEAARFGSAFTYVTDGIESALEKAKAAAGSKMSGSQERRPPGSICEPDSLMKSSSIWCLFCWEREFAYSTRSARGRLSWNAPG